ncbi:MAG: hypothetical protein LBM98_01365 [Oscillospiraceae bacterium]|nr:hypothetical protein [Oscillospiraceae bacterium]
MLRAARNDGALRRDGNKTVLEQPRQQNNNNRAGRGRKETRLTIANSQTANRRDCYLLTANC